MFAAFALAAALGLAAVRRGAPGGSSDGAARLEDAATDAVAVQGGEDADVALGVLDGAQGRTERSDVGVAERAEALLEDYGSRGDCVVARAGYLDLAGKTWGCVIQGGGWVEICLVQEDADGGSESVVWHVGADDVPADVAEQAAREGAEALQEQNAEKPAE